MFLIFVQYKKGHAVKASVLLTRGKKKKKKKKKSPSAERKWLGPL